MWSRLAPFWTASNRRFRDFFRSPDPQADEACADQCAWTENFVARSLPAADLILDQARRVYEEFQAARELEDRKAGELMRSAGTVAAALVALVGPLRLTLTWPIAAALALLLATIGVTLWCRRPLVCSQQTTAKEILTGGPELEPPVAKVWLAASLHRTSEELRVVVDWKARRVHEATALLCVALLLLAVAVFCSASASQKAGSSLVAPCSISAAGAEGLSNLGEVAAGAAEGEVLGDRPSRSS